MAEFLSAIKAPSAILALAAAALAAYIEFLARAQEDRRPRRKEVARVATRRSYGAAWKTIERRGLLELPWLAIGWLLSQESRLSRLGG